MKSIIKKRVTGPSKEKRNTYLTYLWGKITNAKGESVVLEMQTMEAYQLTAHTAIEAVKLVLEGAVETGYRTPAGGFGKDFINQFEKYNLTEVND